MHSHGLCYSLIDFVEVNSIISFLCSYVVKLPWKQGFKKFIVIFILEQRTVNKDSKKDIIKKLHFWREQNYGETHTLKVFRW